MLNDCTETVSILYALIFGAGDACIMISSWSIIGFVAAFLVGVIFLQIMARRLWKNMNTPAPSREERRVGTIFAETPQDDDKFKDSAVWSRKQ